MADIACTYPACCALPDCSRPAQLLPFEYQGWFVLLLLLIGIVVIPYVFYLILGEKPDV